MTNPYPFQEYDPYVADNVQQDSAFPKPDTPEIVRSLMEVYRDTANQLDAEKYITLGERRRAREHQDEAERLAAKVKDLEGQLAVEKKSRNSANDQLVKVREHRDRLATTLRKAREVNQKAHDAGTVDKSMAYWNEMSEVLADTTGKETP